MSKIVLFQTILFSESTQLKFQKTVIFQTIQLSISTQFNSILRIDKTQSSDNTPGQNAPGSDNNKGVLHIPRI